VPAFEFSDRAKQVRAFVFEFWCEHGAADAARGHDAPSSIGVASSRPTRSSNSDRHHRRREHAELQPAKAPPFSSYPSQVRAYIDDEFHSFVGASEAK
jgi:hypothetical protein